MTADPRFMAMSQWLPPGAGGAPATGMLGSGSFDPANVTADLPMLTAPQVGASVAMPSWLPAPAGTRGAPTMMGAPGAMGAGGGVPGGGGMFESLSSYLPSGFLDQYDGTTGMKTGQGWGGAAIGVGTGLVNAFMGMQQLKVAKQALSQSKDQFNRNFEAQRTSTNTQLEDRQRARVASNAGAYESVGSYMDRNAVK